MKKKEQFLSLVTTHIKVVFYRFVEFLRVTVRYYPIGRFLVTDVLLALQYLFQNPYRISKQFMLMQGANNPYSYGETPLTTLDLITRECRLLAKDIVIELGCGTGRTVFWLSSFTGCETIGIDCLPLFIQKAERVKKLMGLTKVNFRQEDFLKSDLRSATVIYLYGTTLEDETIHQLIKKFSSLKKGAKVITISYPLTDYSNPSFFKVEKKFQGSFPWGKADIYLNIRQ